MDVLIQYAMFLCRYQGNGLFVPLLYRAVEVIYDCDFNQMLDLGLGPQSPKTILDACVGDLANRMIQIGQHCYGCTAGLGSSCGGTTV